VASNPFPTRFRQHHAPYHGSRSGSRGHRRKLDFGLWEPIFYGEFDGMRKKRVLVKIIGE
jgi:hypothetical protein